MEATTQGLGLESLGVGYEGMLKEMEMLLCFLLS